MKLLLDTHILLWTLVGDDRLSDQARKLIENNDNEIFYSVLSLWEISLKHMTHPNVLPVTAQKVSTFCELSGFHMISLRQEHVFALTDLKRDEAAPSHKDPFDRMLICQANVENMLFLTHDSLLADYNLPCICKV